MALRTCMFTNTPDEHFILDVLPGHPQVVVASPCSGHGFKFASVIGEILADLAQSGETPHDIELLRLSRFAEKPIAAQANVHRRDRVYTAGRSSQRFYVRKRPGPRVRLVGAFMATTGLDLEPESNRRHLDRTVLAALNALTRIAWMIPWPVWSALAGAGGFASMLSQRRHVVLANVRHARADTPPRRVVAWYIGAQQIATHLRAVIATLRAGFRLPDTTNHLILEGIEGVRPHLGQRGVIIVAPHAGPYTMLGLMGRRWLAEQGFSGELAIVARMFRPFRSGALMQWFMDYFTRAGITVIPVHEPPQTMAKRLKNVLENNGIVVLLVDEPTPTPSAVVPFFDSAIKMPLGPVRLARATGSVIVPTIASYEPGRKMKIRLAEPQSPQGSVKEEMNRLAGALETLVSENLNQWAMLTPIWIDEKPGTPAAAGRSLLRRSAPAHARQRWAASCRGVDRRRAGRRGARHRRHRPRPHRDRPRVEAA